MARVISKKIRQFILSTGDALQGGIVPDNIQLFDAAGQLITSPGINWKGAFSSLASYGFNDGVTYLGGTYRAKQAVLSGGGPPDINTAAWGGCGQ